MIPYAATALFSMAETRYKEGCAIMVEGSYIEIYQERIHGLIQTSLLTFLDIIDYLLRLVHL
jgi:hypothetical protein